MELFFLNSYTESIEEFENSFRYIIPGAIIETKIKSPGFSSEGHGLLSEGFYLGQNITKNLIKLKITNPSACVFQIPLKGHYVTSVSKEHRIKCTPERGCLILPTDSFEYLTDIEEVDDMFIVINYDDVKQILDANYQPTDSDLYFFPVEKRNKKMDVIYNLLLNNILALKTYPHLENSIHFMSSVQETSKLILAELVADILKLKPISVSTSDSHLLKDVENMIASNPESFFNIYQIARKSNTSPRKLQLLFKKYRNCTPMQFLKERKLTKARRLITSTNGKHLIKQVAIDSGFTNLSTFSRDYKKLFGELPSTTLKQIS